MEIIDKTAKNKLLDRVKIRAEQGRMATIYCLGKAYTPAEQISEMQRGTPLGEEWLMAEKQFMDELKKRGPK